MIKANDLRIGNYVNTKQGIKKVSTISVDGWSMNTKSKPIPLTDEWIVKLGLTKLGTEYCRYYNLMYFGIKIKGDKFVYNPMNINMTKILEYVHELQNLFHALTGEELIYNESKTH